MLNANPLNCKTLNAGHFFRFLAVLPCLKDVGVYIYRYIYTVYIYIYMYIIIIINRRSGITSHVYIYNNNNRRLVTLAEHTSDHGKQTNSSTKLLLT